MVDATRELEMALGDGVKRVEKNEAGNGRHSSRRALRAATDLAAGTVLEERHLEALRPCPEGAVSPDRLGDVLGKPLKADLKRGTEVTWAAID